MENIHKIISENIKNNIPCIMVSITNKKGSIPQAIGSIMVVEPTNTYGTIGGGSLEANCIIKARKLINENEIVPFSEHYNLCEEPFNMVCGGSVDIMYTMYGNQKKIHVFGSGHIALALNKVIKNLGMEAVFYDDRADMLEKFETSVLIDYDNLNIDDISSYIVIATRGHKQDFAVANYVKDQDFEYLGILGSKKKKAELLSMYSFKNEEAVYMPAGLKISNQNPEEIAISIVAEILQVKNNLSGGHCRG